MLKIRIRHLTLLNLAIFKCIISCTVYFFSRALSAFLTLSLARLCLSVDK